MTTDQLLLAEACMVLLTFPWVLVRMAEWVTTLEDQERGGA